MTPADFRRIALALPGVEEKSHFNHPDFRVGGRIFATLASPDKSFGMVKLTPDQQEILLAAEPAMFTPARGSWGQSGATLVRLATIDRPTLKSAIEMAWRNRAPKKLLAKFPA